MQPIKILFFGSTTDSVLVVEKLAGSKAVTIAACVTQPPRPVGRKQILTQTPVEIWAKKNNVAVLSFVSNEDKPWMYDNEQQVVDTLEPIRADLIISASYGQKIPSKTIQDAQFDGINIHPSILPRWRGGDPVPWAIMTGDAQIGATVVTLSEKFDAGRILAQKKIPITPHDTSGPLRTHLFEIGATLLVDLLPKYIEGKLQGKLQLSADEPRAKRLSRELGYEPWPFPPADANRIERKFRALHPWPGVWTKITVNENNENNKTTKKTIEKRLKILKLHLEHDTLVLDEVQLEGKNPVSFTQFANHLTDPSTTG